MGNNTNVKQLVDLLNSRFERIFIISLPEATERQQHIQESFPGLHFEWFWGQDKKNYDKVMLQQQGIYDPKKAKSRRRNRKDLSLGEICCSWSHKRLYEKMVHENIEKALILEDDATPILENLVDLEMIFNKIPRDWELLYWGYWKNEQKTIYTRLKTGFYLFIKLFGLIPFSWKKILNRYPENYSKYFKVAGNHEHTHAFAVTRKAAEILVQHQTPIQYTADQLLTDTITERLFRAYIVTPKLIRQENQKLKSYINS